MHTAIRLPVLAAVLLNLMVSSRGQGQELEPAEDTSQPRLVVPTGHSSIVNFVAFSPDGRRVLSGAADAARLWDAQSGKELLALPMGARAVAFSRDGKQIVTGNQTEARLWDARTGKPVLTVRTAALAVAISPDGQHLLTGGEGALKLWNAHSGRVVREFGQKETVKSVAFSRDGKRILAELTNEARLWDADTGKELLIFKQGRGAVAFAPDGQRLLAGKQIWNAENGAELLTLKDSAIVHAAAFSPDGQRILTAGIKGARMWDARTGLELFTLKGHVQEPTAVAFSQDGKQLLTGSKDETIRLWDALNGKELLVLRGPGHAHQIVAFSPDGSRILNGSAISAACLWDARAGAVLCTLQGHAGRVTAAVFSPDGQYLLTGSEDRTARVWDARTGKELLVLAGHKDSVTVVAWSPTGQRLLTGGVDRSVRVWDAQSGEELVRLIGHSGAVISASFSPDGNQIVTGGEDQKVRLWDAVTGEGRPAISLRNARLRAVAFAPTGDHLVIGILGQIERWDLTGKLMKTPHYPFEHQVRGVSVAFSTDSKRCLTGGGLKHAQLWNISAARKPTPLFGHSGVITSVTFSGDGKYLITGCEDNLARLFDAVSGKELCRLIGFSDDGWAVVDDAGRYDSSNGGDVEGLYWVVDMEPVALNQLKDRYYDPGLLAKYLGHNTEPLRKVKEFRDVKLYPEVTVAQADPKKPQFKVGLTNTGGGMGRVVVLVNGKERTDADRPADAKSDAAKLNVPVDLSNDPRVVPGRKNKVEVLAYNSEGNLMSRGLVREFDGPGEVVEVPKALHAVVIGVSQYRGDKLKLLFAAKDAEDMAAALRLAAERLFPGNAHVTLLTTAGTGDRPTRANILKALETLRSTKPADTVVIYLAGHGVSHGGQDGDWYYLTTDAKSADLDDADVRKQTTLSSAELTDLLRAIPAQKQVLILDTCHSGLVVDKISEYRAIPGTQARAVERVKDRTGMHVLAGCAADAVSYEATRYGQGILTYSLLMGMRGAKLRQGEYVDIVDLFSFAAEKVPELARDIGGVQRPTIASPRGTSFSIGRLTAEDRSKVPLQTVKPVLLKASFQDDARVKDVLGLSKRVNDRFREASAAARGATLVFVDADDFPGAVQVIGRYKVSGDRVTVTFSLFEGDKNSAGFTEEGLVSKPDELAGKITAAVEKQLAAHSGK